MNDFDPEQDSCEARQSLLDAPSSSRIERHAEEFLNRAPALRPPIAFVGAGASMAYGRISWRDAVIAMQKHVLHRAAKVRDQNCQRLLELLKRVAIEDGAQVDSGDYLVAFQLSEQLYKALPPDPKQHSPQDFRQRLAELLRDDLGHAQHILNEALRPFYPEPSLNLRRKLDEK